MAIEAAASPPPPSPSEAAASRARQGGGEGEEGESMREEKKVWEMFISPLFRFFSEKKKKEASLPYSLLHAHGICFHFSLRRERIASLLSPTLAWSGQLGTPFL